MHIDKQDLLFSVAINDLSTICMLQPYIRVLPHSLIIMIITEKPFSNDLGLEWLESTSSRLDTCYSNFSELIRAHALPTSHLLST